MKYLHIFLLNVVKVTEHRVRSFIWFLFGLVNPLIVLLFWRGAYSVGQIKTSTMTELTSYYFFLVIAMVLLISHIELDVGEYDIKRGNLTKYLLRPFSYYWAKFFEEIPYRFLQALYGAIAIVILILLFGRFFSISLTPTLFITSLVISTLGFFLSFTFKMITGIIAFWVTDISGIMDTVPVVIAIFGSTLLPLYMMPSWLKDIAYALPFSYMLYFPIRSFQGKLTIANSFQVIFFQSLWLLVLVALYKFLWRRGVRKYTSFGQ